MIIKLNAAIRLPIIKLVIKNQVITEAEKNGEDLPEIRQWIDFCKNPSKRGIMGFQALT